MVSYNKTSFNINKDNQLFEFLFAKWVYLKYFKKKGNLLDLGPGSGNNAIAFKKMGFDVTVCDSDDYFFKRLEKQGVRCYKADLDKKLPFKEESIDFIFAKSVIEHINSPANFLKETNRCLKKGGRIFLLTPNWEKAYKEFYTDPTHKSPLTKRSMKILATMENYKVIKIKNFRNIPYLWRYFPLKSFDTTFFNNKEMTAVLEKREQ